MTSVGEGACAVVVPSVGRRTTEDAVASALAQGPLVAEVIVVDAAGDMTVPSALGELYEDPRVRVVGTGRPLLAGAARQLGTTSASADWVAYLDDDDLFRPTKIDAQLALAIRHGATIVTSNYMEYGALENLSAVSRPTTQGAAQIGVAGKVLPMRQPRFGDDLVSYLFHRTTVRSRTRIVTPSVLVRRELIDAIPWREDLRRFEDWNWLVRIALSGAVWAHSAEPLVAVRVGDAESASRRHHPFSEADLAWPVELLASRKRELGDLLYCDYAVAALKQGSISEARLIAALAREHGEPGLPARVRLALAYARARWDRHSPATAEGGRDQ